ncbi:dipeptide epimerase [Vagococcus acidifermentans]|uniref:Dipeptide epimerase n=1 Tax=Vagococcus acidifermentans TaxID=564710 RepID=A0A430AYX8_9ENTE|nr:dipeptide epimerase [Vagococcus acidifermentans]RSU13263.1 dipeptide epimerase [Vagococcus acidifermentans]
MKITKIDVMPRKTLLKEPFKISLGWIDHSVSAVVHIHTDEGISGCGEGSPGILITGETLDGTVACIELFAKSLIGVNPLDIEKVHDIMDRIAAHAPSAKAAIDIACYDILGKKAGLPVYQLLGGHDHVVKTDMTVGIESPERMAEKAKYYVAKGFDTIKIKVGDDFATDLLRVKHIREAVGSGVALRLDANQGWSPKEAVTLIHRLADYDIELVEQPVPYNDFDGLKFVTSHVDVPIMSDESCFDSADALKLVADRVVDIVNIKLMKCGGIFEALRISNVCQAAGVECMIGCMVEETNIGVTAAAHLAAGNKNITRADLDAVFSLENTPVTGGITTELTSLLTLDSSISGLGFDIT